MMDGLTIMLGVFINLLYTYTLPNNHYSTTYMLPYPHLMAKHCLKVVGVNDSERSVCPSHPVHPPLGELQSSFFVAASHHTLAFVSRDD